MATATSNVENNDMEKHSSPVKCETGLTNNADAVGAACMDKTKEAASSVAQTVGEAGAALRARGNEATAAVASSMKSLAATIRDHTPSEGVLRAASSSLAESLESGGNYLQEEGLDGMAKDITNLVRRNPVPAMLVGVGIGLVLAKVTIASFNHGD